MCYAFFATSTRFENAAGSLTAMSAKTFLLRETFAFLSPLINLLYEMLLSLQAALILVIQSALEAREIALPVCPFDSGFFVTVPTEKAEEVAAELRKSDLFVVPLGEGANAGLRIALCAIPEEKITGIPQKIKNALDIVENK